ncbi:MAG: lycopene cyclase protein [Ferruginibacter sp.]|nr:lycopene cyclase protein [Ferruginibacter sp.]
MLLPAVIYIAWDVFFTAKNVWSFNDNYITGIKFINLPIEEVLFFFVVPYCCVFIYECIKCYFPQLSNKRSANIFMQLLAAVLLITGLMFYKRFYTSWAFVLCALFIINLFAFKNFFRNFNTTFFLVAYAIILIPFLLVNGFLTAIPVVLYNDAENLGIRIYTIPMEDVFYGMLLIMMNIALYEKFRNSDDTTTIEKQKI